MDLWHLQGITLRQAAVMSSLQAKAVQVLVLPNGMAAHANHCKFVQTMTMLHSFCQNIPFATQVLGEVLSQ